LPLPAHHLFPQQRHQHYRLTSVVVCAAAMVVMVSFFAAAMTIVTGVVTFPASSPADDANYSAAALGTVHVTTYRTKRRGGRIFPYVGVAGQSPVVVVIIVGGGGVAGTPKADGGH